MILFRQIELLQRIHKLIKASNTGTPYEFARQMRISERHLREIIDELKDRGAPIDYSRRTGTYYYKEPFEVDISCTFRLLSSKEKKIFQQEYLFFQIFPLRLFLCREYS